MLQTFQKKFYTNFIEDDRWKYIWEGLGVTLQVTLFAVLLGTVSYTHLTLPTMATV